MRPIDRILACSARVFGLSWPRPEAHRDRSPRSGHSFADEVDLGALECCAAEGFGADLLMQDGRDGPTS
ncbi:MAG TPA: hypothetical protein VGE10_05700 [Zeimonas sp.]